MTMPKDPEKAVLARQRMSESHRGVLLSLAHREAIGKSLSVAKTGVPATPAQRKAILESAVIRRGISLSPAHRKAISDALVGHVGWNRGRSLSPSYIAAMSEALKGVPKPPRSLAHCNALSVAKKKILMSLACRRAGLLATSGPNCHMWKGGTSFLPYYDGFNERFKEWIREIYGYQCQFPGCRHVWQPGEKKLAVHHTNYDKMTHCSDDKPPFVPLCHGSCHSKTNFNREYWQEYFTNLINEKFGGKCYFTTEEYAVVKGVV